MGAVYLARRSEQADPVALKVMLPALVLDEAAQEIFLREIEITRSLRHPNIVGLLDFGKHEGRFYFALEYCARGSAEALRRARGGGRLSLPLVLRIASETLEGLAAAHDAGFVHRDLKPDNVLLAEDGTARIADFGLAKSFQQSGLSGMTATGAIAGTYFFMPREQLTSFRTVRPVSDVWSMAATLYHLLTGKLRARLPAGGRSARGDPAGRQRAAAATATLPFRTRSPRSSIARSRTIRRAGIRPPASSSRRCGACCERAVPDAALPVLRRHVRPGPR